MRVLVAGGAGFIGSHLCEALLQKGHEVTCVDNLISGRKSNLDSPILRQAGSRFKFLRHDIQKPLNLKVSWIFNLASPASPPHYQTHSIFTLRTGSEGTYQLLLLAKKNKARFLQASTSEVYGDPAVHPQREDYWGNVNPIGLRACYDEAKRFAEALCMEFWRKEKVDVRMVRIFNTYGPRLAPGDGRVVSNFIVQALRGDPLTVYGDGTQTRSLCFVDDEIGGLLALLDSSLTGPVNIGNPDERTMLELAHVVLEATGSSSDITFEPLPQDDPTRRCPDITLARSALGWEPTTGLGDGIGRTIEYFERKVRQGT